MVFQGMNRKRRSLGLGFGGTEVLALAEVIVLAEVLELVESRWSIWKAGRLVRKDR